METLREIYPYIGRRNFLILIATPALLTTTLVACSPKPNLAEVNYSLYTDRDYHGVYYLFLPKGGTDPSSGVYAATFGRIPIVAQPLKHSFRLYTFEVGARVVYTAQDNNLSIKGELQFPKEPKPRDTFVATVGLSPGSLSYLVFTWKNSRFSPQLNYQGTVVNIQHGASS